MYNFGALDAFKNAQYTSFLQLVRDEEGRYDLTPISEIMPIDASSASAIDGEPLSSALLVLGGYVWDVDERRAIAMFREAAEAGADGASATLGESLNWMGAHAEAAEWLLRAFERGEGNSSHLQGLLGESLWKGEVGCDASRIEELLRVGMESSSEFGIPLAQVLLKQGREDEAASVLQELVDAGVYGAALMLGNLLSRSPGNQVAAEAAYRSGIASGDAHSAHNLAAMLLEQGDEDGARDFHLLAQDMGDQSALE